MSELPLKRVDRPWSIPDSWTWTFTSEVAQIIGGGTPPTSDSKNFEDGEIPWITPADLTKHKEKLIHRGQRNITERGLNCSGAKIMPAGTVLFSSRAPIGYVAVAANPVTTSQGFKSFVPTGGVGSDYLYYYMQFATPIAKELASGTTFLEISGAKAALIPIPVAPSAEQNRIVAEIEKQFTRLDAATAALKRVQANLKRYRASVLKAACEGQLMPTEAELARKEGRDYEPADKLLQRILRDRRARWEADTLAKMMACGKPPKDDRWKERYKEPVAPDIDDLPALPQGWVWASLAQLAADEPNSITDGPFGSNLKTSHYTESGPRVIRLQNIGDGVFRDAIAHISESHYASLAKHAVYSGDLVIAALGDPAPRACILPDIGPAIVKADCIRFKPSTAILDGYILAALNSEGVRKRTTELVHGVGRPRLNLQEIRGIVIPMPPLAEQRRLCTEAERVLSILSKVEAICEYQARRASRLRHSILSSAYSGKLVPQDPHDEAASVLLHRIRNKRAQMEPLGRGKRIDKPGELKRMTQHHSTSRHTIVEVLKDAKEPLTPEALFSATGCQPEMIDEFYGELKEGFDKGWIEEIRTGRDGVLLRMTLRENQLA